MVLGWRQHPEGNGMEWNEKRGGEGRERTGRERESTSTTDFGFFIRVCD